MIDLFFIFAVLVWGYFSLKNLTKTLLLFPILFPTYLYQIKLGVPMNLAEVLIYLMFLIFVWQKGREINFKKLMSSGMAWGVVLFLLAATIGVLMAPESASMIDGQVVNLRRIALGIWKGWIVAPLLYFFMLTSLQEIKDKFRLAMDSLVISGLYLSLLAIAQVVIGNYITIDQRASGPFTSANYLSLYLAPIFIYLLVSVINSNTDKAWVHKIFYGIKNIFKKEEREPLKYFYLISLLITGTALFLTKSYAAFLAIFVSFVLYYLLMARKSPLEKMIGFLLILVIFSGLMSTQAATEKFNRFMDTQGNSSSSVRFEVWQVAGSLIKQNFLGGIGLGTFSQQYNTKATDILEKAPQEWEMLHPHNLFMAIWLNTGFLGLISFALILFIAFRLVFRVDFLHLNERNQLAIYSALMLTVILIHGLFDTPFWKNDLALQFWLIIAGMTGDRR